MQELSTIEPSVTYLNSCSRKICFWPYWGSVKKLSEKCKNPNLDLIKVLLAKTIALPKPVRNVASSSGFERNSQDARSHLVLGQCAMRNIPLLSEAASLMTPGPRSCF